MAKKKFISPFVLLLDVEPTTPIDANASAHGSLGDDDDGTNSVVYPMDYEAWLGYSGADMNGDEKTDWTDYKAWFVSNHLDMNRMDPLINPYPES